MVHLSSRAWFRFHGELNDHLLPDQRHVTIEKPLFLPAAVKDMIESLGVPHTEVDVILVNGEPVAFSRLIRNGDRVAVYPVSQPVDIAAEFHLQPAPLQDPRFVLDVHLGKLAGHLRMLGFDTLYSNDASDPELVHIATEEQRILLTRDRGVLKHSEVRYGYWLRATDSRRQTAEIVARFELGPLFRPLTRCLVCNALLRTSAKTDVCARVPAKILEQCEAFQECPQCGRVYWEGSHSARMRRWIEQLRLIGSRASQT